MLAECSAGPETSTQESSRTRVDRGSSRDRTINTDTVSSLPSPSVPICKYIRSKQDCPYGPVCRFRHPSQPTSASSPPVCRMFLASRCTYGDRCRYAHPTSDNRRSDTSCDPQLGSLTSFPSLGHDVGSGKKVTTTSVVQPVTSSTYQSHQQQSRQRQNKKGHDRGRDVPELNLGAYFERSARITPRPHMSRPVHRQHGSGSKSLLEVECAQLETRFPSPHSEIIHKGKDKTVYSITYTPTDPEWEKEALIINVTMLSGYPREPIQMEISDSQVLLLCCIKSINVALRDSIAGMFQNSKLSGQYELMFRPLLHWLDSHVTSIVNNCQCLADKGVEDEINVDSSEDVQILTDDSEDEEEEEEEEEEGEGEVKMKSWSKPQKRGTEVRLQGVKLATTVATLRCSRLKLSVQCTRCRHVMDITCSDKRIADDCPHCHQCYCVVYHSDLVHATNMALGFMDMLGCQAFDVVLPGCECWIACMECGKESTIHGLSFGQPVTSWCSTCHAKLCVGVEEVKFFSHQMGDSSITVASEVSKSGHKKKKELRFQEGTSLPDSGTCEHYKKSHRWLRFPCCGKAYPCDVCHDTSEDHIMERAKRMICGYCSKEQTYTGDKPCVLCGSNMTSTVKTSYWEGGQGCRNRAKMSRNDHHKYAGSSKTSSKKSERVGSKGKANREST